jgi:hypothetical protein
MEVIKSNIWNLKIQRDLVELKRMEFKIQQDVVELKICGS